MKLDKFDNPIFNSADVFNAMYAGHIDSLPNLIVNNNSEINQLSEISEIQFRYAESILTDISVFENDKKNQNNWFMPESYFLLDIEEYCLSKCQTVEERTRVADELREYSKRNMMHLLQWLMYFVDTCRTNKILWGVGRGSSVASYVLYLIGVHRINSIKYNLDWKEFLR